MVDRQQARRRGGSSHRGTQYLALAWFQSIVSYFVFDMDSSWIHHECVDPMALAGNDKLCIERTMNKLKQPAPPSSRLLRTLGTSERSATPPGRWC